jgi:dihydrolipoamide dehydrogenase
MTDGLLPGVDRDLVKPLANHLATTFKAIHLNAKVTSLEDTGSEVNVGMEGQGVQASEKFDKVLIAVGRRPNSRDLGLENTSVTIDEFGFVEIDQFCRTQDKRILAIGDISGQPMLAHRAMRQGVVAAEVLAGLNSAFDNRAIPAVVFTEPEIAWCGLTENDAKAQGLDILIAKFPWSASGRAMTLAEPIGQTKVIFHPQTKQLLGVGIVGPRAGELIAEAVLAIEMGSTLEDLIVTIHPHPTLSETMAEASATLLSRLERQKKRESEFTPA